MAGFRPTAVVVHPDVEADYARIEAGARAGRKGEAALWKSLQTCIGRIRLDGQWGEVIPQLPAYFADRYGARNLYCIDLVSFHRAFYTIEGRTVILLDIVDHSKYDKWFPGSGRR